MRVVFAGTPEVALPALAAVADSAHELVGVVTRPDAPAGRGRRLAPSPVAEAADALGVPVLKPGHPREPEFQAALRALAPGRLPGRRLRRPAAAVGPRHPPARLGQPALLAAARLARRGAGAARDLGRRRRHRRHHVPDRQGARRRTDVRADDRDDPPRRHRRRPARPARRGRGRAAGRHARRHRRRVARGAAAARRRRLASRPRSPSTTPASTGPSRPPSIDRQVRACTPGAGRLDDVRRRAAQARPAHPGRRPAAAGRADGRQERRRRRHRRRRPAAGRRAGGRQAPDAGRRLGARAPARPAARCSQ